MPLIELPDRKRATLILHSASYSYIIDKSKNPAEAVQIVGSLNLLGVFVPEEQHLWSMSSEGASRVIAMYNLSYNTLLLSKNLELEYEKAIKCDSPNQFIQNIIKIRQKAINEIIQDI